MPASESDLKLMRRIDELHTELPFLGSRQLQDQLGQQVLGRRHPRTLMRKMGVEAIYRRNNTSRRHPGHAIYPYLAAWARHRSAEPGVGRRYHLHSDGPWLRIRVHGDGPGHSPSARLVALQQLERVLTDSGAQFTGEPIIGLLTRHRIKVSLDGRGCWRENVFVERLWRSVKYEEFYLHTYEGVSVARAGIGKYFAFYNARRTHTALDRQTPDHV